ncbi:hypothetical protein ACEWY4_013450 [Coilia grayii]|uniref:Transmembrane protein 51 n=1 Tax=Coilia grayii TaxID=363190 RepID=A0ABD1JWD9_9TELE
MCSSRSGLCGSEEERGGTARGGGGGAGSGSQYALCALGAGLVALGIVMIIWTIVPFNSHNSTLSPPSPAGGDGEQQEEEESKTKTSSVAFVLVGSGMAMLLLAICLGVRNKKRLQRRAAEQGVRAQFMEHTPGEEADLSEEPPPNYSVPSYEEAVGSGQYPIRQSNLRNSSTHLPSYEDLIAAVENETDTPGPSAADPPSDPQTTPATPTNPAPPPATAPPSAPRSAPPQRSSSRASRILRPLRVRRIKSEKLHLRDIRLNIRPPAPGTITIEPITPPPQYDDKPPEL